MDCDKDMMMIGRVLNVYGEKTMRIHEQWKRMKSELESKYSGITIKEYGGTIQNGKETRGPHVTLMIPAKQEEVCHCCKNVTGTFDIKYPTSIDISRLLDIVDKYLCMVTWDGNCRLSDYGGNIERCWYYEIIFDTHGE